MIELELGSFSIGVFELGLFIEQACTNEPNFKKWAELKLTRAKLV